jgi:hypothetical protein
MSANGDKLGTATRKQHIFLAHLPFNDAALGNTVNTDPLTEIQSIILCHRDSLARRGSPTQVQRSEDNLFYRLVIALAGEAI